MEGEEHKWEQEGVEKESNLRVRKSRTKTEEGIKGSPENNGHATQALVTANGAESDKSSVIDEPKREDLDGILEQQDGLEKSENYVYYDKDEGVEFNSSYSGEQQIKKNPQHDKVDFSSHKNLVQNNSTSTLNGQHGDLEDNVLSMASLQSSNISSQEHSIVYKPSKEIESAEIDPTTGDELEVTEFDVERVLQKQTTHDLYCPNCNSCITKRVILRKRKRHIRVSDEEAKRNKLETRVNSRVDTGIVQESRDQVQLRNDFGADGIPTPNTDDNERNREPEIFRCLSCFSFFIPTRNGFKLFRVFGEKAVKENVQDVQVPSVKKNWFSIFSSNRKETSAEQGSRFGQEVGKMDVGVFPSTNLGDQAGQPLSTQPTASCVSEERVDTTETNKSLEGNSNTSLSSKHGPPLNGMGVRGAGVNYGSTEKKEAYTSHQLKSTAEVLTNSESELSVTRTPNGTQVTNGEPVENGTSFLQNGGLKLLISSSEDSVTLEKSEKGQITSQIIEKGKLDEDSLLFSTKPVSALKESDEDGKGIISVDIPHNLEQHTEASLVTGSVVETKNANFTSTENGMHTVLTIDPPPVEVADSQRTPDIIHPAETRSALHSRSQTCLDSPETETRKAYEIEVIKSIVYGGLAESITSLSVVSSAAGGDTATLNVIALGLANLIGGLFIIIHNLWELKSNRVEQVSYQLTEQGDRYKELLGRRENFMLHATVALLSYFIFGLVPPVTYGFSFLKSDDREFKLLAVAAASLLCIVILAIGRVYCQRPRKSYLKTVVACVILGFMVSGVSYAAGVLIKRLLDKLGLFQSSSVANLLLPESSPARSQWSSY